MEANLFIMFSSSTARFNQDEALGTVNFFLGQSPSLAVLDGQIIGRTIDEFERREDFR